MKDGMEKFRTVRLLCVALVSAVLVLSLLLLVAVCGETALGGVSLDTSKNGFWDILPDGPFHPDGLPETIDISFDSSDHTREPDTIGEWYPGTDPDGPGDGDPGSWGGGLVWPTLPPTELTSRTLLILRHITTQNSDLLRLSTSGRNSITNLKF